ncbi:alpha/beta fold hydrolase [Microbacterium sp. NPDC055683]
MEEVAVLVALIALGAVAVVAAAVGGYAWNNLTYADRARSKVAACGFVERQRALPSGAVISYAEGPANGAPVLLVHGQASAWESYAPVLPDLSRDHHVLAVDVVGHGSSSRTPGRYSAEEIGTDLVAFIDAVIGAPVILSGHSSGGLVALWIAAHAPDRVASVLLEDPPLFSTEVERMPRQFNYVDLAAPAHAFLAEGGRGDFAAWYAEHNAWIRHFGRGAGGIARFARKRRRRHPDRPLRIWFLPPSVNKAFAHMHEFDPRFADAFYRGTWQAGFDQQAAVEAVDRPALLVHANWRVTADGILEGAMTDDDAARAGAALRHGRVVRVDTGHTVHDEDPRSFAALIRSLPDGR